MSGLSKRRKRKNNILIEEAVKAYKEVLISLGKLSEVLGIDVVSARLYLKKQGIRIMTQKPSEILQDAVNA